MWRCLQVNSSAPEFVPMIWCIDEFNDKHNENRNISDELARVPASAEFLLGFNEPDLAEQSNIPDPFKVISSVYLCRHLLLQFS